MKKEGQFMSGRWTKACLAASLALSSVSMLGAGAAQAADMVSEEMVFVEEQAPAFTFTVAPYFWMAGMKGSIADFGAPPVDVDVKFSDILQALDFSMMVVSEVRYDRFSLFSDLLYLKISTNKATPIGFVANSIGVGAKTLEATLMGGYALIDTPEAHLDLVGGARLWSVENTLSVSGGALSGLWLRDSSTWVDAMAGVKGRFNITQSVYFTGWALAGGGSSDSSWDLLAGIGYDFNDRISGVLGYRAVGVDYEKGPFLFDVTMQGPIMGAVFRF